ncbi:DUF2171 domain-containing protein [uncultured Sphingomonas sp.]|uniref:DUF2171 domain-containing protein n=1 Tax=uncultured Sphingomonas sp. TaxID=158754 RepID=UPI0035C9F4E9
MSIIRYPGTTNEPNPDFYGRDNPADYGPDRSPAGNPSGAREYAAAGEYGAGRSDRMQGRYRGANKERGNHQQERGGTDRQSELYRGSYAHDGHRFEDVGRYREYEDDDRRGGRQPQQGSVGRQPQGSDYDERNFLARAGDEVRSWFGDDEAERRRDRDTRHEGGGNDDHHEGYHQWRTGQIADFDRDFAEYRQENQAKFHTEFTAWRGERQSQRLSLTKVEEHMEILGSDGEHVGTVDKIRGDHILLARTDKDAGGHHHMIPSRWIQTVDGKVTLRKTAAEAKQEWRDVERSEAENRFGDRTGNQDGPRDGQGRKLDRNVSRTY